MEHLAIPKDGIAVFFYYKTYLMWHRRKVLGETWQIAFMMNLLTFRYFELSLDYCKILFFDIFEYKFFSHFVQTNGMFLIESQYYLVLSLNSASKSYYRLICKKLFQLWANMYKWGKNIFSVWKNAFYFHKFWRKHVNTSWTWMDWWRKPLMYNFVFFSRKTN